MNFDEHSKPKKQERFLIKLIDEEYVILDVQSNEIHQLNSSASVILNLCDGTLSIKEISQYFSETYSVPYDLALKDVANTIDIFNQKNIITL